MRPTLILFDVNETLSDLSPLGARFVAVGASGAGAPLWFSALLRDGFALTAAGVRPDFAEVARETLAAQLSTTHLNRPLAEAVSYVLDGMSELPVHADVVDGVHRLAEAGYRLVTLSNGSTSVAERLLEDAGVRDRFERLLTVADGPAWKPAVGSYTHALEECGVAAADAVLVASHAWDVDGARRAGLRTVWVNRMDGHFPAIFEPADHEVRGLEEVVDLWE